ncbi:MAG: aldo/keto reductase [Candidatus Brocadiia bacterium]|jgi:aryl-alcohol dehydrogenase-like predicted oxidoreductase|nr:aldo/keto reductase [Candidatus Brocadiia bacterium]
MRYREIGKSDLKVSPVCLGTMTFGTPVEQAAATKLTHAAIDHGINFIDTANIYEGYTRHIGSPGGVSEELLGKALSGRREKVVLATKGSNAVGPEPEDRGLDRAHIMREIDRSLKRLRTDYVDIYYMHRPDPDTPIAESVAVFNELIDAGKARYWGFSNYSAAETREMLDACDEGGFCRPIVNQPPFSLLKRDIEKDILPLCKREGIAVVPFQILQSGLLTGKYRRGQAPPAGSRMAEKVEWVRDVTDATFDRLESIERCAKARGLTMIEHAITWTLRQPGVASVIIGSKRPAQIEEAIAAAERC